MKDLLLVIYMCWTPVDSLELAVKHGYTLEQGGVQMSQVGREFYEEIWNVGGKKLKVVYLHPVTGNKKLFCYYREEKI